MSDYLDRLVLRVRQPDLALQPRLLSRFESAANGALAEPALGPGEEIAVDPRAPEPASVADATNRNTQPASRPDRTKPDEDAAGAPIARIATAATAAALGARPQDTAKPHVPEAVNTMDSRPPRARVESAPPERVVIRPVQAAPALEPAQPVARAAGRPAAVERRPKAAPAVIRTLETRVHPAVRIGQRDEATPGPTTTMTGRATEAPPMNRATHLEAPSVEAPRLGSDRAGRGLSVPLGQPEATRHASDPPVIHVTIGRVEVRANIAPPPRRKTSSPPPALNLDDYLKQRSGASRE